MQDNPITFSTDHGPEFESSVSSSGQNSGARPKIYPAYSRQSRLRQKFSSQSTGISSTPQTLDPPSEPVRKRHLSLDSSQPLSAHFINDLHILKNASILKEPLQLHAHQENSEDMEPLERWRNAGLALRKALSSSSSSSPTAKNIKAPISLVARTFRKKNNDQVPPVESNTVSKKGKFSKLQKNTTSSSYSPLMNGSGKIFIGNCDTEQKGMDAVSLPDRTQDENKTDAGKNLKGSTNYSEPQQNSNSLLEASIFSLENETGLEKPFRPENKSRSEESLCLGESSDGLRLCTGSQQGKLFRTDDCNLCEYSSSDSDITDCSSVFDDECDKQFPVRKEDRELRKQKRKSQTLKKYKNSNLEGSSDSLVLEDIKNNMRQKKMRALFGDSVNATSVPGQEDHVCQFDLSLSSLTDSESYSDSLTKVDTEKTLEGHDTGMVDKLPCSNAGQGQQIVPLLNQQNTFRKRYRKPFGFSWDQKKGLLSVSKDYINSSEVDRHLQDGGKTSPLLAPMVELNKCDDEKDVSGNDDYFKYCSDVGSAQLPLNKELYNCDEKNKDENAGLKAKKTLESSTNDISADLVGTACLSESEPHSGLDRDTDSADADDEFECDCIHCQQMRDALSSRLNSSEPSQLNTNNSEDHDGWGTEFSEDAQLDINVAELSPLDFLLMRQDARRDMLELMFQNVILQMLAVHPDLLSDQAPPPASESVIAGLPAIPVTQEDSKQEMSCPICLCLCELEEPMTQLPCHHLFHPLCIQAWLVKSGTCPVCRHIL